MSGRSRTPWAHELFDGSSGSFCRGSFRARRQRARRPIDRAREAGGALGMCAGLQDVSEGGMARAMRGRRAGGGSGTHAGSVRRVGGVTARARAQVRGVRAHLRSRSRRP